MTIKPHTVRNAVACPQCEAAAGDACRYTGKGAAKKQRLGSNHQQRVDAFLAESRKAKDQEKHGRVFGRSATVIADASFCPKHRVGGWATWVRVDGKSGPIQKAGPLLSGVVDAASCEVMAALNGIAIARQAGARSVLVQTDCLAVVLFLNGDGSEKNRIRFNVYADRSGLDLFGVRAKHVKGHTDVNDARSFVNRWCDELAKQHMREQRQEKVNGYRSG